MIADRTFKCLSSVVSEMLPKGEFFRKIYELIFCYSKESVNINNFFEATSPHKILMSDREDMIIKEKSSLPYCLANREIEKLFGVNKRFMQTILGSTDDYDVAKNIFMTLNEMLKEDETSSKRQDKKTNDAYLNLNESFIAADGVSVDTNRQEEIADTNLLSSVRIFINERSKKSFSLSLTSE